MIRIPLKVKTNLLTQEELVTIASGSSNSIKVKFDIDPNSDFADSALQKRAIFRYYQGSYFISDVDANGEVYVPKFVIAYPYFKVALRAESENATVVVTTNEIQVPVEKSPVFYETTITDGDVTIRNLDGALNIYKAGDVTFIDFTASYKTAVDAVIAGTYATTSALNLVASDVNLIKDDIINMSASISDLQGDIQDLETTKANKSDVYTKEETEERLAEKQPVGNYATLENGKIPASQLPSYVDDVLEYASISQFPSAGETGKIYVALDTNKTYRWGGTEYVEISSSLALGETASTAYPGNKGKENAETITALQDEITNIKNGTTPLFETITDIHGNPRFVEGDITIRTISGITQTYGKWSLSGTHLMIVVCIDLENVTLANNDLAFVNLPSYIKDKIDPLWRNQYVDRKSFSAWTDAGNATNINCFLSKTNDNIGIKLQSTASITTLSHMRIQFDLLIDAS